MADKPTEGMIEAAARAICEADGCDPDDFDRMRICDKDNRALPLWQYYEEQARAAIAAMRPTIPDVDGLRDALTETTALLSRYRKETPPGHSPHMICHLADAAIERAEQALERIAMQGAAELATSQASPIEDGLVEARIDPATAQTLMDWNVLHFTDEGWVIDLDIWRKANGNIISQSQSIRVMREEIEGLRDLRNFVSCAENDVTVDMARKLFDLPDYSSTGKARSALGASGE